MQDSQPVGLPSLAHLRKLAKHRLLELRRNDPVAKLSTALLHIARDHGFSSWRALKAQIEGTRARSIASPAVRFVAVTDIDRSAAFYRDILGFEIKPLDDGAEASLGPARIHLGSTGYSAADYDFKTPRPPGSAVVFLQCDDVVATRAVFRQRGGSPTEIENVNWIKMRMFEIRDPDGNVLWFGQSYHRGQDSPSRRDAQPQGLRQALPEVPSDNVAALVAYYRDVLGFKINYQQHDLGVMDRDKITIVLIARTEQHKGIGSFGVYVSDADALYAELVAKKANVLGPPVSRPWGLRDFRVIDPEGNRVTFMQTFE